MARFFEIPPQKRGEVDYAIIGKIKAEMFSEYDDAVQWIEFAMVDAGKHHNNRFTGIQMRVYAGGTTIRRVMVKDGKIDIDKCIEKFEELKEIKRKYEEWNQKSQRMHALLKDKVDRFRMDMTPMPPGFVIGTYGDDMWEVKYEVHGLPREKAARIVAAIREALQ